MRRVIAAAQRGGSGAWPQRVAKRSAKAKSPATAGRADHSRNFGRGTTKGLSIEYIHYQLFFFILFHRIFFILYFKHGLIEIMRCCRIVFALWIDYRERKSYRRVFGYKLPFRVRIADQGNIDKDDF